MAEPVTLAELWDDSVRARPDAVFLRFETADGDAAEWTYGEFDRAVARTAGRLAMSGVGVERGVHLALTNTPHFVVAWLAALRLGSWVVPSDPMATASELAEHLTRTRPAVSVVASGRRAVAVEALGAAPDAARDLVVLAVDEADPTLDALASSDGPAITPIETRPDIAPTDRAAIMFTSGTTGRPKGVVVTHANYAFAGLTMAGAAQLGPDDRQLVVLPMFHANAQYYSFAPAIAVGASVALMPTFSASRFIAQAARHEATHASLFAGPMRMILARGAPWRDEPALKLTHCWYAQNITADQYDTLSDWLGCRPRQLYGMTETIAAVLSDTANDPRHDAMGFATSGCRVALHDAEGRDVADGEVGEIVVGGDPGTTLFGGYLDDPTTTAASFRDGWFLTGDRARVDASGRYVFDGRRSDVLKVAGENVSTAEVEAVVGAHPDVFDVVVVGAPDEIRDEVPVAYVVAAPDAERAGLADRLGDWCVERLAKAKRPRSFTMVDELPRTSVGKVRKFLLGEDAAAKAGPSTSGAHIRTTGSEPIVATDPSPPSVQLRPDLIESLDASIEDVANAATLPPELYTSADVFAFERDAIYAREWLCVGRAEKIPEVGDWFTVTICEEPILVARDKSGEIRAMSAVCQHRAMQVCDGDGNSSTFKCPYHHWIYGLDGRLLGAPAMERTDHFDKADYGLPQFRVETWQGFVFVNLDPDAAPLTPTLSDYDPFVANYDLADAVCPGTFVLKDRPWNWKVMFENFNDGYHANRLHQYVQDFCPSNLTDFPTGWHDGSNVIFREGGYTAMDGGFNATHQAIMPIFPKLSDEERSRSTFALVPPTLCLGTAPDQAFFFLVRPTGPETVDIEVGYIFHPSALEDPLFEHKLKLTDVGVQVFVEQDTDATTKVQRGLRSRFAPRGRYSWQEESHVRFNRWLVQRYRCQQR